MSPWLLGIIINESKIYVVSGYMRSLLGRIWKNGHSKLMRGTTKVYCASMGFATRRLVRIEDGDASGVAAKFATKYGGAPAPASEEVIRNTRASFESGNTWAFELQPR